MEMTTRGLTQRLVSLRRTASGTTLLPEGGANFSLRSTAGSPRAWTLMARCQLPSRGLRLIAALYIDDGDVRPFLRQHVTNALPKSALAARHDRNRALKVHEGTPPCLMREPQRIHRRYRNGEVGETVIVHARK